jgi:hypothetical protein
MASTFPAFAAFKANKRSSPVALPAAGDYFPDIRHRYVHILPVNLRNLFSRIRKRLFRLVETSQDTVTPRCFAIFHTRLSPATISGHFPLKMCPTALLSEFPVPPGCVAHGQ